VELRAARPSDNRRGSRRRAAAPEEEYEEEEEVPLTSKAGNSTPMPIDYGYDDHDTSLELTAHMLNLENDVFMGPKTRRGSTGIMPVQYTIPEAAVPKINRRASTGQEYRNEMCPPTPPAPSNRMGRRGSAGSIMTNRSELSYLVNYSPSVASHVELRETQQMVYGSYFPKKTHRENSDSEEDADYITAYGYGQAQGGNRDSMVGRRCSDFSLASRSSSTKQNAFLRSSKGKELQQTAALKRPLLKTPRILKKSRPFVDTAKRTVPIGNSPRMIRNQSRSPTILKHPAVLDAPFGVLDETQS
jgi:hypothetical protein